MSVESSPDILHTHQLNYKPIQEANCKYRYQRVPLNNTTSSGITVQPTASGLLEWKVPNCVYNLHESFIGYTETISGVASRFIFTQEDTFGLANNIYFGNASGADLCNLNYANKYIKVARKINTTLQDFLTNDGETSSLYPSNNLTTANLYPANNQTSTAPTDLTTASYLGVQNYIEPTYLSTTPAVNQALVRNRLFRLGDIPETIFAVDKDIYIPSDTFLRVTVGPGNMYAFTTTSNTDLATSANALAGNITLSNVFLYLATETNQLVIDSVMSKVQNGGLNLNIPYTTAFRNATAAGSTVANINIPLSSQYGKKLSKILNTVWNGNETTNYAGDIGNRGGTKVQTYITYLNNRQLQDSAIDCQTTTALPIVNYNDWRENSRHCAGSVILNRNVYGQNWFALDQMYEDNKGSNVPDENRQDGYDMTKGPVTYQFQATLGTDAARLTSGLVFYQFASFSRDVQLNNQGFIYV